MIPDHLRCTSDTQAGERCKRQRATGEAFCEKHRRYRPQVEVPAQAPTQTVEKVQADLVTVMASAGIDIADPDHLEPVEVMRWVVVKAHNIAERFTTLGEGLDVADRENWAVYRQAIDALEAVRKSAEAAESAGMQRRRVAVEEAKVQALFLANDRAIQRAGMTPTMEKRFREMLGEELHALSTGG